MATGGNNMATANLGFEEKLWKMADETVIEQAELMSEQLALELEEKV